MNAIEKNELVNYIQNALEESIESCPKGQRNWYKFCDFEDYADSLVKDLYEDDNCLGEGIDFVSGSIVITDDNRKEIKELFEIARDRACRECLTQEIKNYWFIDNDNDEQYRTLSDLKSHVRGLCKEDIEKLDGTIAAHYENGDITSTVEIKVKNQKPYFGKTIKA